MRKLLFAFTTLSLAASLSWPLYAQSQAQNESNLRYKWVDSQGQAHFTDSLTGEALKYGYDVVNDQGRTVKHVARPLTPDEQVAAKKLADAQAAKQHAEQARADADTQMLAAYPDEAAFKTFQQRTLDTIDQQTHTTELNLRTQEKALADLLDRAAEIERSKHPVPKFLSDSIASQQNVVTDQRNVLGHLQTTRAQAVTDQAAQLAHYRELQQTPAH